MKPMAGFQTRGGVGGSDRRGRDSVAPARPLWPRGCQHTLPDLALLKVNFSSTSFKFGPTY